MNTRSPGSLAYRIDGYFNIAAFSAAPQSKFGNVGRLMADNRGPYLLDTGHHRAAPYRIIQVGLKFVF